MNKEYLTRPFEIKELKEENEGQFKYGIIKGYGSTFGNIDEGGDRVMNGAFKKTLKEHKERNRQIRMYFQHNPYEIIGGWETFKEDKTGLWLEGKINLEVQKGREIYALAKQGVITDLSIGYWAKDFKWTKEDGVDIRELHELELFEVSPVGNPMNRQATIESVKSITDVSTLLKSKGFSNKESNEIIYHIKKLVRNDTNDEARNETFKKIDSLKLVNTMDNIINKLKRGA